MTNVIELAKQAGFQNFLKPADRPEMICDPAAIEAFAALVRNAALEELKSSAVIDRAGREWWATTRHTNGPRTLAQYASQSIMDEVHNTAEIIIHAAIESGKEPTP